MTESKAKEKAWKYIIREFTNVPDQWKCEKAIDIALQEQAKEIYKKYISDDLCDCPVCLKKKRAYFKKYGVKEEE